MQSVVLVRVDCDHNTINSDTGLRNDGGATGRVFRRCDEDENDGEESPLQSKRSSRCSTLNLNNFFLLFFVIILLVRMIM